MDSLADEDSDAFCENINNFTGDLRGASKVLDACQKLNAKSLVNLISEQFNMNIYFYNIDGNKSNFNTLTAELNCFKDTFSLIGLTEKNVDSCHKDLYPLDGFKSYYSDKLPNKSTGTGVALYIHESFNALTC